MLFVRGDNVYDKQNVALSDSIFGHSGLYTSQRDLCAATGLRTYRDSIRLFQNEKSLGVLSNNQSHVAALERTLRKATQMKIEKAFLHHYHKFGVSEDDINTALMKCEETLLAYKML